MFMGALSDTFLSRLFAAALMALPMLACSACSSRVSPEVKPIQPDDRVLWIADDHRRRIYRVVISNGVVSVASSFKSPPGDISGISFDPRNGTLWSATERGLLTGNRILHLSGTGSRLGTMKVSVFDPSAVELEGVAIDPRDGTLWIVDDSVLKIYHLGPAGDLLSAFRCSAYDLSASSPQEIDVDTSTDSLWLTDNHTNSVYNVSKTGDLISSFKARDLDSMIENLQGIAVDSSDGTLWITARNIGRVYNVTFNGTLLAWFNSVSYDRGSRHPTAIAVARVQASP